MVFSVSPARNPTVPLGRAAPKSAAEAGWLPAGRVPGAPATLQPTVWASAVPPLRVTLKVKSVVPLPVPSASEGVSAAMPKLVLPPRSIVASLNFRTSMSLSVSLPSAPETMSEPAGPAVTV